MKETTKAMRRRMNEAKNHTDSPIGKAIAGRGICMRYQLLFNVPWKTVFSGNGIDVGSGDDPLDLPNCIHFDRKDGDANALHEYFQEGMFDYLHSSQCLEHMVNPWYAFESWVTVVRPGGHLVITVPSFELYEKWFWPSQFNSDHKSAWSMTLAQGPCPQHVYVPAFCDFFQPLAKCLRAVQLAENFDWFAPATDDQTLDPERGVEPWIEMVFQRL